MLTADWSWRWNVLYYVREEREPEPEPEQESPLSEHWPQCVSCCVSVQVCILWRTLWSFEVESFRETLLTSSIVKCDSRASGAFPGCVTRCFTLTSWFLWRSNPRYVALFSLSFFFFGRAKNLGICEAAKDQSGTSSKNREKKEHLEEPSSGVVT